MQQSISNSETKKIMLSSKTREKSRSEWIFEQSIKSEETKKSYLRVLKKYKEFVGVENTEELLNADRKMIQEKVEDFVISMKGNINPNSFPTQLASIFLFYDLSDIVLNKTRIRKLYPAKIKKMGREAYSREDIRFLLENTNKKRSKAIILIFTSTGIRVGGLCDLRISNLLDSPREDCKCLRVYADEKEEYFVFLTPESSNALEDYLQERIDSGEKLTPDKPLISQFENYGHGKTNSLKMTRIAVTNVFTTIFRHKKEGRLKDKGGNYSIPTLHGTRKYFNKTMKMREGCNLSICEKLMGHSTTIKLDNDYLPVSREELFKEFERGISYLTIGEEERQLLRIAELEKQQKSEEDKEKENEILKEEMEILKLRIHRMELSQEQ